MEKKEILKQCTIEGFVVKLPDVQLERKVYQEVAKSLELIGGKWNRSKQGFVFAQNPVDLLKQIQNGEKRNLKKEFQFYGTPDDVADFMIDLLRVDEGDLVLEPSAGQGALIKALNRQYPNTIVDCFELMDINREFLKQIPEANLIGYDFLKEEKTKKYDLIIANPPFAKNQDIDHVREMYKCLNPGGVIASITSKHWSFCNNKKEKEFRDWIEKENCTDIFPLSSGSFKSSGTMVSSQLIVIYT